MDKVVWLGLGIAVVGVAAIYVLTRLVTYPEDEEDFPEYTGEA